MADLAAGRVVIAVVKDAILVGTVENPIEEGTHPPIPVPIASDRLGVILGAVDWLSPSSHQELARLDQLAPQLHAKLDLPESEPLAELIVVDYLPGYGQEVWQLSYGIQQEEQDNDYWTTRVLRPAYLQFWPPEKGQPRTLVEFAYPPENPPPTLLELLRNHDPRLEKITASDPKMAEVATRFLQGESNKISAADATQFLRAALDAIAPPNAPETMARITEEDGFSWILAPPPEPKSALVPEARPAGAPTLMGPQH